MREPRSGKGRRREGGEGKGVRLIGRAGDGEADKGERGHTRESTKLESIIVSSPRTPITAIIIIVGSQYKSTVLRDKILLLPLVCSFHC
jgi:hypothetical protein